MAYKFITVLLLAVVAQGYAQNLNEVTMPDQTLHIISNPLFSRSIAIAKSFLDTLVTCHVVYPNGVTYEAYPNNRIPDSEIENLTAASPFNDCSVAFRHSDRIESFAGTYELQSLVSHSSTSFTLTKKRFHISFSLSEVEFPQ